MLSASVVVPTYRRGESLERCLCAILEQTSLPLEILVVLRPVDDPLAVAVVARLRSVAASGKPRLRPVVVLVPGLQPAMEAGVAAALGDVVVFTDDDAVPRPDWLGRILAHYVAGVGGVGGRDEIHQAGAVVGGHATVVGRVSWCGRATGNHHLGFGDPRFVDVLKGVNLSLRRSLYRFDYRLAGHGSQVHSEMALCLRARRLGWRLVYDPLAVVDHFPAPRPSGDSRTQPSRADVVAAAYNFALPLFAYARPVQRRVRLVYRVLWGDRSVPGVGRALAGFLRRENTPARLVPALDGVWRAWRRRALACQSQRFTPAEPGSEPRA